METTVFDTSIFATALIYIAIGVLVKRFPILIAGYNTMSDEEKENVDVKGLSTFICFCCVMMGIIPILFYYTCLWLGHADWAGMSQLIPLLCIPYMLIRCQKYDHNKRHKNRIVATISVITVLVVVIFMSYGVNPSRVKYDNGNLTFSGMFGLSRPIREISYIRISDTIPNVSLRLNGLSVGGINKGLFKLEDGSTCHLFLSSSKAPYIVFTDYSGREIYFNQSSGEKTMLIYRQLEPIFRNEDIKGEMK
jgi:hypothetical protein